MRSAKPCLLFCTGTADFLGPWCRTLSLFLLVFFFFLGLYFQPVAESSQAFFGSGFTPLICHISWKHVSHTLNLYWNVQDTSTCFLQALMRMWSWAVLSPRATHIYYWAPVMAFMLQYTRAALHSSAFTITKVIALLFGWKRKVLVLEENSSDFPRPGPGVLVMGATFALSIQCLSSGPGPLW